MRALIILFFLFLLWCSLNKNITNQTENILLDNFYLSWWNKEILLLTWKTTWLESDKNKFKKDLLSMLENKNFNTWTWISEIARLYEYLWYIWAATIVYENWLKKWWVAPFSVNSNLANLYKKLCKNDLSSKSYSSVRYCKKSLKIYYDLINKYKDLYLYKDVIEVLIYMWKYDDAKKAYKLFLKKWWKKDSLIEDKLFMKDK